MGKIALQVKANLENVTNLRPVGSDFRWYLKFKCMNCGEASDKWQYITVEETFPIKGSRGEAHFVTKCKLCARECSVEIIENSLGQYTQEDSNAFKPLVSFDCRGLEPVDFSPRSGFAAEGTDSGTQFKDIDLAEKEWVDYDEKAKTSVGVYEFEFKFVAIK